MKTLSLLTMATSLLFLSTAIAKPVYYTAKGDGKNYQEGYNDASIVECVLSVNQSKKGITLEVHSNNSYVSFDIGYIPAKKFDAVKGIVTTLNNKEGHGIVSKMTGNKLRPDNYELMVNPREAEELSYDYKNGKLIFKQWYNYNTEQVDQRTMVWTVDAKLEKMGKLRVDHVSAYKDELDPKTQLPIDYKKVSQWRWLECSDWKKVQ